MQAPPPHPRDGSTSQAELGQQKIQPFLPPPLCSCSLNPISLRFLFHGEFGFLGDCAYSGLVPLPSPCCCLWGAIVSFQGSPGHKSAPFCPCPLWMNAGPCARPFSVAPSVTVAPSSRRLPSPLAENPGPWVEVAKHTGAAVGCIFHFMFQSCMGVCVVASESFCCRLSLWDTR